MNATRIFALVLIIAGLLGLLYGTFSYTRASHQASIGPIEISVTEKKRVDIPIWLGAGAVIAGVLLLFVPVRK